MPASPYKRPLFLPEDPRSRWTFHSSAIHITHLRVLPLPVSSPTHLYTQRVTNPFPPHLHLRPTYPYPTIPTLWLLPSSTSVTSAAQTRSTSAERTPPSSGPSEPRLLRRGGARARRSQTTRTSRPDHLESGVTSELALDLDLVTCLCVLTRPNHEAGSAGRTRTRETSTSTLAPQAV